MNQGLVLDNLSFSQGDFSLKTDLTLPGGTFACLLGPSGSGKTTLLRIIAGFAVPSAGRILLGGRDLTPLPPHRRKLGIVFQDYALFPHLSVRENILYGLAPESAFSRRAAGWKKLNAPRVEELLKLVRLEGYGHRKIGSLSGGEQQRVALARALAPEPDLLLLDEPLSALDVQLRTSLRLEIKRIQETLNVTTLYITHDQEEALALADLMFVMNKGKIIQRGTPEDIYNHPRDLFTGTFLGLSNTVPGVLTHARGTVRLNNDDTLVKTVPAAGAASQVPQEGFLFFRPEDCFLPTEGIACNGEEYNSFSGIVRGCEFRGPTVLVYLDIRGELLRFITTPAEKPQKGQTIRFLVPVNRCHFFPERKK